MEEETESTAAERREEKGGEGGEAREPVGEDTESKIKAWQQRRMSKKRESFTVSGKCKNTQAGVVKVSNRVMQSCSLSQLGSFS